MTKPIPDKAEVAIEFPDKLCIGTFARSARFEARLDEGGIALILERTGDAEERRSVHVHLHYGLLADILSDLARTVSRMPPGDVDHRQALRDAAQALQTALADADDKEACDLSGDQGEMVLRLIE